MRVLRSVWVSLTNGTAIYFMYGGAQQVALLNHLLEQDSRNKSVWFHFVLSAAIPILGISRPRIEDSHCQCLSSCVTGHAVLDQFQLSGKGYSEGH